MRPRPDRGPDAWELIVPLERDPVTQKRRQRSKVFRGSRSDAETELARLVVEVVDRRNGPGTEAPLLVLVERWLEMVRDDLSPTTVATYEQIIRNQIAPGIGKRPVSKITTPELDGFYRELLKTRAPATVRQTHAILRRAFRQAVRWGWVPTNPAVEATPPRVKRKALALPSADQVGAVMAAAAADDESFGCLLRVLAATGARRAEIVGLRWSRVDLVAGSVLIESTVVRVKGSNIEKDTKTHQARRISLDPGTVAALKAHRKRSTAAAVALGTGRDPDPFVFCDDGDPSGATPMNPDMVTSRFRRYAKAHAPGVRLHDLRHFAATQLLAAGVPVKTVSGRLGHATAAMTLDVYGHHIGAADQTAADLLGAVLDG
jgi:integrase